MSIDESAAEKKQSKASLAAETKATCDVLRSGMLGNLKKNTGKHTGNCSFNEGGLKSVADLEGDENNPNLSTPVENNNTSTRSDRRHSYGSEEGNFNTIYAKSVEDKKMKLQHKVEASPNKQAFYVERNRIEALKVSNEANRVHQAAMNEAARIEMERVRIALDSKKHDKLMELLLAKIGS